MIHQFLMRQLVLLSIVFGVELHSNCVVGQENNQPTTKVSPLIQLGRIVPEKICESSGLAICETRPEAIWTINDSGNPNEVYLLSTTGELLATVELNAARNVDWEAMCGATIDGKRYLIVGDVGDNRAKRNSYFLYVFPEPKLSVEKQDTIKITPARIEFKYADGPRNCEAIAFDRLSGEIWLIEKRYIDDRRKGNPGIYLLPMQTESTGAPLSAKRIGDFPVRNVTGMSFSPDGTRLVIRNYLNAHVYQRLKNQTWRETIAEQRPRPIALPLQRQGEAVCFTKDSNSIIVTSEIKKQPIWLVNLNAQLGAAREGAR